MSDFLTSPLLQLSSLFDEEIEISPTALLAGTKVRAVLSGAISRNEIHPSGNGYVGIITVRYCIQKSELATLALRTPVKARGSMWKVESVTDTDTSWSGELIQIKA